MGTHCIGICDHYDTTGFAGYVKGYKYCTRCNLFIKVTSIKCPCCNTFLRTKSHQYNVSKKINIPIEYGMGDKKNG